MPLISTLRLLPLLLSALGLMTVDSLTNNSVVEKKTILRTRRIISFSVATFFFVLSLVAASCSVHSIFDVVRVLSLLFFPNNLFLFSKNSPAYHLPLLTQQFSFKVYKRHKHTHNWNVRAFCVGHRHFGAYKLRLLNWCVAPITMQSSYPPSPPSSSEIVGVNSQRALVADSRKCVFLLVNLHDC